MLTNFFKKWLKKKIVNLESGSLTITFPNKNILQLGEGSEKADLVITSWKGIWLLFTLEAVLVSPKVISKIIGQLLT